MNIRRRARTGLFPALAILFLIRGPLESADLKGLIKEIFPIPSTPGNEEQLAAKIRGLLPGELAVEEDGLGGFALRLGRGEPRLVVIAALDGYGFIVSGINPEGYLTLDRPVPAPHPQFDAYLLGQPVLVSTRGGLVQGVVSQPAMHLLNQERQRTLVDGFSLEHAFVDIGVRSEKEARDKGVEILDPVTFWPVLTELAGERWAGPSLGLKAVCAALVSAAAELARSRPAREVVLVWAAQTKFTARGRGPRASLGALRAKNRWRPQRTIILDLAAAEKGAASPRLGNGPVLAQSKDELDSLRQGLERSAGTKKVLLQYLAGAETTLLTAFGDPEREVLELALPVQFIHTPSEIIDLKDIQMLRDLLGQFLKSGGE
jgi:endoglucanase